MNAKLLIITLLLLGLAGFCYAQATGTWALTTNASCSVTGSVTGADMVKGTGTGAASYGTNGVYSSGWNSGSMDSNDYYQYTLTATANITINTVSFDTMRSGNRGTARAFYSVNSATEIAFADEFTVPSTSTITSYSEGLTV